MSEYPAWWTEGKLGTRKQLRDLVGDLHMRLLDEMHRRRRAERERDEARASAQRIAAQLDIATAMSAPEIRGVARLMEEWANELREGAEHEAGQDQPSEV